MARLRPPLRDDHLHRHDVQLVERRPEALLPGDEVAEPRRSTWRSGWRCMPPRLARYRRGVQVTSGNALAARLARCCFKLGIPIHTDTPAESLIREGERVTGAVVKGAGGSVRISARRGRGAGLWRVSARRGADGKGLSARRPRRRAFLADARGQHRRRHPAGGGRRGARWRSAFPRRRPGCRSRRCRTATEASRVPASARPLQAWRDRVPQERPAVLQRVRELSRRRRGDDRGLCRRAGDGVLADRRRARRSAKYGLGYAKPAPLPLGPLCGAAISRRGRRWRSWRRKPGSTRRGWRRRWRSTTGVRCRGGTSQFHRGETAFNRYLADPEHEPNPCVAPVGRGAVTTR